MNLTKMDQKTFGLYPHDEEKWIEQISSNSLEMSGKQKNCKFVISLLRQWFSECFYGGKQV